LIAGDWLYVPARWWHVAKCVEDSLSISLGVFVDGSWRAAMDNPEKCVIFEAKHGSEPDSKSSKLRPLRFFVNGLALKTSDVKCLRGSNILALKGQVKWETGLEESLRS
jgi:hypothetical protein